MRFPLQARSRSGGTCRNQFKTAIRNPSSQPISMSILPGNYQPTVDLHPELSRGDLRHREVLSNHSEFSL